MAEQISYLIIGNGIAGITAAETLRAEAPDATIGIVADDPLPVYYRPALKDYLAGRVDEEKLWARPARLYQEQKIFFLPERVVGIQGSQHIVQLQSRGQINYGKLLLANGAHPAQLQCPGSELQGVTTLRTVADYQAVLARLPGVRRVVVVGSGTLALETAESLRTRGVEVSHLLRKRTIWSEVLDTTASDLVMQQELRAGIDVQLDTEVVEVMGERGEVKGVVTNQGKRIRCDLVLVAIGIEPNIAFIRNSNILCGRGVQVDRNMRTSVPGIYAAGDVVESRTPSGRSRVLGQWYPAVQQARAAAYDMLGIADTEHPFNPDTFYNATFLYGLDFASVGLTNQIGCQKIVSEPKPRYYRKVLLQDGVPVGMLSLGERKQALAFKRAIDYRVNLSSIADRLFDADFKLSGWLDAQGVPPLRMGVRKAGDTATRRAIVQHEDEERAADVRTPDGSLDMEDRYTQKIPQSLMSAAEALLVHMPDPKLPLRIAETTLQREGIISIGRQAGVDLLINEGSISRRHAEIRYVQDHYELRDFGSLNGTFLNENRIEPNKVYVLTPNDVVRFGNIVKLRFLLRILNVAARSQIEADTGPLPRSSTDFLKETVEPLSTVQKEATTTLNLTSRLSTLKTGSDTEKSIPLNTIDALKDAPGLVIMPEKGASREQPPRIVLLRPGKRVMLGREEGNDVVLEDMDVSRRHAEIFPAPAGVYIRDNNSSNGVFINKSRIDKPYRLSHGDRIRLGRTEIFFVDLQAGREQTTRLATPPVQSPQAKPVQPPARIPVEVTAQTNQAHQGARVEKKRPVDQPTPVRTNTPRANAVQAKMKACPQCGTPNMPTARFCARCSALLFNAQ